MRVAQGSGLDRALARMVAHRAASAHDVAKAESERPRSADGGGGGGGDSPLRPLVVGYDASDAASVDRVVALAHAAAARETAAAAAREHGLLGEVRRHRPARGCPSSASEDEGDA